MYDFAPILCRIKQTKKECGLTNDELSVKSGIPIGTLRKILSGGTTEPKLPALMAIASALDVSADYLIYGNRATEGTSGVADLPDDEARLLSLYRDLSQQGKEYILQTIEMAAKVYIKSVRASDVEAKMIG